MTVREYLGVIFTPPRRDLAVAILLGTFVAYIVGVLMTGKWWP